MPQRAKRSRSRTAAGMWWAADTSEPAPLAQAEELVFESSFPRGLASAECFEVCPAPNCCLFLCKLTTY